MLPSADARELTPGEIAELASNTTHQQPTPEFKRVQKFLNDTLITLQNRNVSEAVGTLKKAEVFVLLQLVVPANLGSVLANLGSGDFSNSLSILNNTRTLLLQYGPDINNLSRNIDLNLTRATITRLQTLLNLTSPSQLTVNTLSAARSERLVESIGSQLTNEELDQGGTSSSSIATSESEINKRPISLDASFSVIKNTPTELALSSRDPDNDRIVDITIQDNPKNGIISNIEVTDNPLVFKAIYTPNFNFVGEDRFTFTSSDPFGTSNLAATISLNIDDVSTP